MEDKNTRANANNCTLGVQTGPQTIIVRQVIGEVEKQKVLDITVTVPEQKPSIEQIVDVFVKDVEVNCIDVITDKIIVRGEFEIKAIYVACLPEQPVHAVEIRHYKWTQDIAIPGARRGMDADASVAVEFVDYDIDHDHHHHHDHDCRGYKYKNFECMDDDSDDDDNHFCSNDCYDEPVDDKDHYHHDHCLREFTVSVVLKITGKVLADREVQIGSVPVSPKG